MIEILVVVVLCVAYGFLGWSLNDAWRTTQIWHRLRRRQRRVRYLTRRKGA